MLQTLKRKRQRGATLLELVMFIGLAALILIGGVSWYQTASEGQRVSEAISNLNAIAALVRNTFTTQNNFVGLNNAIISRSSQFPDKMRIAGSPEIIKSGWAQQGVDLAAATVLAPNDSFTITYNKVPEGPCIDFTSKVFRFFEQTTINGNEVTNAGEIASPTSGCNGTENTIVYRTR